VIIIVGAVGGSSERRRNYHVVLAGVKNVLRRLSVMKVEESDDDGKFL
jgi:hypothetical protein